jgi:Tol biopolymer transport system component
MTRGTSKRRIGPHSILTTTALALLLVVGLAPAPALATHPGPNGRIVFYRADDNGFAQVWTANPDLSAPLQLTHGNLNSGWATWAPDGSRIAFDSDRSDPDPTDEVFVNDVFTMRADGTDVHKVTDSHGFSGDPAFSPDGTRIAFDANRGATSGAPGWPAANPDLAIFTVRPDGSGLQRVTTPPAGSSDTEPRFSPDGQHIVFTRFQGGHFLESGRVVGDTSALFVVRADGTGLRRITGWGMKAGQADWSPDGSRIVFEVACCRLGAGGIYTVNSTGGALTAVVNGHGVTGIGNDQALQIDGYYDPVWSPDGTKILAGREYLEAGVFRAGLVVVEADGTGLHWLAPAGGEEHQPDWGSAPLE